MPELSAFDLERELEVTAEKAIITLLRDRRPFGMKLLSQNPTLIITHAGTDYVVDVEVILTRRGT